MSKFRDSRLYDALDYLDEAYIAEVVENLKVPPAPGLPARKGGQLRYILALAACLLVLSAAIPVITYVLRNYTEFPGWLVGETTADTSPELTEPETPPSETTAPLAPETTEEVTTAFPYETTEEPWPSTTAKPENTTSPEETTAEETTTEETTSPPEPEYDGSRGLEYKISDDGKSAFLVGIGTCTDKDIVVASTYNGLPVTEIGGGFSQIDTIRSVTVSENVTFIAGLRRCANLEEVHLPKSLSDMSIDALESNPKLKVITIDPDNPKFSAIGNCLIEKETKTLILGCKASVIPSDGSVIIIGAQAFEGSGITEITIPYGIVRLDSYAFAGLENLKSVTLPDSVTTVGYAVFSGCTSLESFVFSENTKNIGSWVFSGCTSLKEVKMPTYGSIGEGVFDDCTSLESIVIPIGQDILHIGTFSNCASLETVVLPDTLTQIHSPFPDCISLKSITIPAGVTIIEHYAFYNCATLSEINFKGTIAEWKAMEKENGWNRGCPFTVIHCSDGDISP